MRSLLLIATFLLSIGSFAQKGRIDGKITESKTGNPLAGISVLIKETGKGIATDQDGRFVLNIEAGKKYTLVISSTNYESREITEVETGADGIAHIDVALMVKAKINDAVIIKSGSARKETVNALIGYQRNTAVVAQVISAETIRRSPDKNTSEVLKRVPGTSVQEGKYLVVRGLADRYNQAMLNGILLSSTEPDRKTFSFDIFPSAMIDNIIINKAFVPELPGEWAGGLVQVNTKDIPAKNFISIQLGTGFNTNVIGNDFYTYKGSNLDFLGFDNKVRTLPDDFPNKSTFSNLTDNDKLALGKTIATKWAVNKGTASPNSSLQLNGGFTGKLFNKKVGGIIAVNYNRSLKHQKFKNSFFTVNNSLASPDFIYNTDKYAEDVLWGGLANFSIQLNNNNKITVKNLFNVNATDYASMRTGQEFISGGTDNLRSRELAQRTNIFYNTQVSGDHSIKRLEAKITWFGSFNILDQYVPQQRRLEYIQTNGVGNYEAKVSTGQSQKSGSVFYSNLSDYIYTAGGDIAKTFTAFHNKQTIKGGYFIQVKDRLFDSRPFFIKLFDNSLKTLPEGQIFNADNFVSGKLGFDEFVGKQYRYMANTILNAGYLQFDNMFTDKLRAVWGLRYENFDQLVGSVKQSDSRFVHSKVEDFLPAINLTYKLNKKTNLRLSGSQTVVRPEFRELSDFAFYDFELGATVLGNKQLQRTKITNADIRYELYPRAGELFTLGVFYKYFTNPIEAYLNQSGAGSSNTFNFLNADKATGYGVEFEMRKKLDFSNALKNFTFTSNLSYIHNRVTGSKNANLDRPMQGQSPYVINAGLQYDLEKQGITSTLLFNQIGRRVAYVGNDQTPVIWEAPRPLLDFQLAKKVIKNKGELRLNVIDIINKQAYFYHDLDINGKYGSVKDALAIERKYGTTFSITFGYNIK
jgi:outer membrane receptor for ferrienterochelin and colicin